MLSISDASIEAMDRIAFTFDFSWVAPPMAPTTHFVVLSSKPMTECTRRFKRFCTVARLGCTTPVLYTRLAMVLFRCGSCVLESCQMRKTSMKAPQCRADPYRMRFIVSSCISISSTYRSQRLRRPPCILQISCDLLTSLWVGSIQNAELSEADSCRLPSKLTVPIRSNVLW